MLDAALLEPYATPLAAALWCSLALSVLMVLTKQWHGRFTLDGVTGIQKFHAVPTPRVGGIGIYAGLWAACLLLPPGGLRDILLTTLAAGLPAFLFGVAEDVTKRVGVLPRLVATMASGLIAWAITGIALDRVNVLYVDMLFAFPWVGVLFTAFSVAGVANAINIIDGFHGLASGFSIVALVALAAIAGSAGDVQLMVACVAFAAAIAGFWFVNYPWGKLFLGDGGAYFAGFAIGWMSILLPMRNPEVSVWAGLLVCAYPVTECVYSMVRRYRQRRSPGEADWSHLHSLFEKEVVQKKLPAASIHVQNAAVSPVLLVGASVPGVLAVFFYDDSAMLAAWFALAVLMYHLVYRRIAQMEAKSARGLGLGASNS